MLHAADLIETTPELFDAHSDAVAAVPYVDRLYESLSYLVMRAASYVSRRPFKVVVVDCDNTLWRGVVGEEGPGPLQPNLPLQRALKACAQRGLVLATCSKNIAADVEAAFAAHPEWPLAYSDFVVHKASAPPPAVHAAYPASSIPPATRSCVSHSPPPRRATPRRVRGGVAARERPWPRPSPEPSSDPRRRTGSPRAATCWRSPTSSTSRSCRASPSSTTTRSRWRTCSAAARA